MTAMLRSAILATALLLPQLAAASGPIATCYQSAETAYSARSYTLTVNGSTFATTADIDHVGQFVARFYANPTMSVSANSAGENALKQALNCLLTNDLVTLSGFFLNEMSAFQVRTNAYKKGSEVYDLGGVTEPGDGNRYMKFLSQSTFNTAMLSVADYGTYDGVHEVETGTITGCLDPGGCADYCAEECSGPEDVLGCHCDLGGECVIDTTGGVTSSTALVSTT